MATQAAQKLELLRQKLDLEEEANRVIFKRIAAACEHRKDNGGKRGMYAQIHACKASGIRTLKACDITTCPAIH